MSISHLGIYVANGKLDEMANWYLKALAPLGYKLHVDLRPNHPVIGMGGKYPDFWITECPAAAAKEQLHVAFYANSRQQVRDFHALAMKAGAKDNGPPGLRAHYASTYYAAYVFDPEGRNIEVHAMTPAFMSEPSQWNAVVASAGVTAALGLAYFANYAGYLDFLRGLM